jgi:hypothetical protein
MSHGYDPVPPTPNSNNVFQFNYAKDINEWYGYEGDPFTIGLNHQLNSGAGSNNIVQYNLFENVSSDREIISIKFSDTRVMYNTFVNNTGNFSGIGHLSIRSGNRSIIEGNYFLGTWGGIRLFGENHKVYNNYIDAVKWGVSIIGGNGGNHIKAYNCKIANNTIVNTCTAIKMGSDYPPAADYSFGENSITNNILYIDEELTNCSFCVDSMMRFTEEYDPNSISADPLIWENNKVYAIENTNATPLEELEIFKIEHSLGDIEIENENPSFGIVDNLYKLTDGSDMINSGEPISFILKDIDGQNRTGIIDIGADEYSVAPITNWPLTPDDVGPSWIALGNTYNSYEDFMDTITSYKQWDAYDPVAGHNPAFIRMPNFNSGNSILQFHRDDYDFVLDEDGESTGFKCIYNPNLNRYVFTCDDYRPRTVHIAMEDFNENPIQGVDGTETSSLYNSIVKTVTCKTKLQIIGNGEDIKFNNNHGWDMILTRGGGGVFSPNYF